MKTESTKSESTSKLHQSVVTTNLRNNLIPVSIEPTRGSKIPLAKDQLLFVKNTDTMQDFIRFLRKRLKVNSTQSISLFLKGTIPSQTMTMLSAYNRYKDHNGWLNIVYGELSAFG